MCAAENLDRRPLLKGIAVGAVGLGAVGVGARTFLHDRDGSDDDGQGAGAEGQALLLAAEPGSDIDSLSVPLGEALLPATGRRFESARLPTSTHSMVALTWADASIRPHVRIRSRAESGRGGWGEWQRVPLLHDRPDRGDGEGNGLFGTELVWIGASDGIQVQVGGRRPDDLSLLLLHPRPRARDRARGPQAGGALAGARRAGAVVPRPDVLSRVAWGADESWRSGKPRIDQTVLQVHVHHTVSRNDYLPEDVPALLRGMYRYHTKTLGWSDIAYNFLVDRFGRVWTGRSGGAARPVRGAHTLGFNQDSCGISAIGNFDLVPPSVEMLGAIAATAAWKLDLYARDPLGTQAVVSQGSDRYRSGATATLPVIDGHRDTNDTSCPGGLLYAALPDLRNRTKAVLGASAGPVGITAPATVSGTPALGQTLTASPGAYDAAGAAVGFAWLRDGVAVPGATAATYAVTAEDVGRALSVRVDAVVAGRPPATQTVAAAAPVTAPAVVRVSVKGRRRRAVVKVSVSAPPGVALPAEGQVVISTGSRRKTVTLSGGTAKVKFKRLVPGERRFRATYGGSGALTGARRGAKATVPA